MSIFEQLLGLPSMPAGDVPEVIGLRPKRWTTRVGTYTALLSITAARGGRRYKVLLIAHTKALEASVARALEKSRQRDEQIRKEEETARRNPPR